MHEHDDGDMVAKPEFLQKLCFEASRWTGRIPLLHVPFLQS